MAKQTPQLSWCVVKLGSDMNWWVIEVSDPVHWDVDGLSILDPRQVSHIMELCEPLREYGFDLDILEDAFFTFRVEKEVKDGQIKLQRIRDSILTSDEKLFALPDILAEDKGPYADLLTQMVKARVKLLNDTLDLEHPLTVDELEEVINERNNIDYSEGRNTHIFNEIISVLEFVPEGFEDEIDEARPAAKPVPTPADDIPEAEEEDLEKDETMRWGDEDDEEEKDEDDEDSDGDDEDEDDDDGEKKPSRKPSKPSKPSKPAPAKPSKPTPPKKKGK